MKGKVFCKVIALCTCAVMGVSLINVNGMNVMAATTVKVDFNDEKQEIDGFGVSQAGWSNAIYDLKEPVRSEVLDLLFSQDKGIGLDIFRGETSPVFCPSKGVYDFTQFKEQPWVMQQAKARGVSKIISTTWTPPAWMKDNNQTNYGGFLKKENYGDYAELLAKYVKAYKELYGIDFYAISMSNEPNAMKFLSWNSCEWNGSQIKDFLGNYLKPTFEKEGLQSTKVIAAEPSMWKENMMVDALNDEKACSRIDIVGSHNYVIPVLDIKAKQSPFTKAQEKGKKVWMTEVSDPKGYDPTMKSGLKFAREMHTFMTNVNANAYLYWTGAIPGNNDEGLINVDLKESTYACTKRFYTFGNYSKFIKPGYTRVGAPTNPVSSVYLSAYKDPSNSKLVMVAVNDGDSTEQINITPSNFKTSVIRSYVTDDNTSLQEGKTLYSNNGVFNAVVPAKSVITYVANANEEASNTNEYFYDDLKDFSKAYSHTEGLVLDNSNSSYFNGDASRAKRNTLNAESVVYKLEGNVKGFSSTVYHNKEWDGVAFYVSKDGVNWTRAAHTSTPGEYTSGGWYKKVYSSITTIEEGNKFLKAELSGAGAWNKQISDINIEYSR